MVVTDSFKMGRLNLFSHLFAPVKDVGSKTVGHHVLIGEKSLQNSIRNERTIE